LFKADIYRASFPIRLNYYSILTFINALFLTLYIYIFIYLCFIFIIFYFNNFLLDLYFSLI